MSERERRTTKGIVPSLLLSIRPEHARRIYSGDKRFELRKFLPSEPFQRVFLLETGGHGVSGSFDVRHVHRAVPLPALWRLVGERGTTRDRFDRYFDGFKKGCAITVGTIQRWPAPLRVRSMVSIPSIVARRGWDLLSKSDPVNALLHRHLEEVVKKLHRRVTLRRLRADEADSFADQVGKEISRHYDGIDEAFAHAILRSHDAGTDPNGFITRSKEVLVALDERARAVGFTCLTYKYGGSVKTGPTILRASARARGYGQATRRAIERYVAGTGFRKLYCTCPDVAHDVIKYLLGSGMTVEAHLGRQYATQHGELVLGKILRRPRPRPTPRPSLTSLGGRVVPCSALARKPLAAYLQRGMRAFGLQLPRTVLDRVVTESLLDEVSQIDEKPKRLVCVARKGTCITAVVLVPKRGGAIKAMLLRGTSDTSSLRSALRRAEKISNELGSRKLYFIHPLRDSEGNDLLRDAGFEGEGLLKSPYGPGVDLIVFSKRLAAERRRSRSEVRRSK